jgi:hypothetical protein
LAHINSKCGDGFLAQLLSDPKREYMGSVDPGLGIGMGDEMQFIYCLDCGQLQGNFPLSRRNILEDNFTVPLWRADEEDEECEFCGLAAHDGDCEEEEEPEEEECDRCGSFDCCGDCDYCHNCGETYCDGDCEEEEEEEEEDPYDDEEEEEDDEDFEDEEEDEEE